MQENLSPGTPPPKSSEDQITQDTFLTSNRYPGQGAEISESTDRKPQIRTKGISFTKVILPLIILFVAIGAAAFVMQYAPSTGTHTPETITPPALTFVINNAIWDVDDPSYVREMETSAEGHYDFPFQNATDSEGEFRLTNQGCGCSEIQYTLLDNVDAALDYHNQQLKGSLLKTTNDEGKNFPWKTLNETDGKWVKVPPKSSGLLRIRWTVRGKPGSYPNLSMRIDHRTAGKDYREPLLLKVGVIVVMPILFSRTQINFEDISENPKTRTFYAWSATQRDVDLAFFENESNPCVFCKAQPIPEEDFPKLTKRSKDDPGPLALFNTKIKKAYRVSVTVVDAKKGKRLEMGPFRKDVPMTVMINNAKTDARVPLMVGKVPSLIKIDDSDQKANIALGQFRSERGLELKTILSAKQGVKLRLRTPLPKNVNVRLKEKGVEGGYMKWQVDLTVPPSSLNTGSFSEALLLEAELPSKETRQIRIPLSGTRTTN